MKCKVRREIPMSKKNKKKDLLIPGAVEHLSDNSQYNLANMICTLTLMANDLTDIEEEIYLCCVIPMLAGLNEQYYGN
tara:strand:- start:73 stop:306 length:234 start_codon:yes stop_codon:yes gene_type:complete